ncbi:MAG: ABC transporter permease [Thermomicrobiales bacterium]|nr:ABC transporter permease [Thermomicrobiales bacterium]
MSAPPTSPGVVPSTDAVLASRAAAAVPTMLSSLGAVAIALLVGGLIMLLSGENPVVAYAAMFEGAFGGVKPLAETLIAATPLILGGLAFAVAAQAGLFNIGIEGQMMVGGLAGGLVAALPLGAPAVIHLPLALLAAVIGGGFWGFVPGILKARTGAHEVITTIMLNYLALRLSTVVVFQGGWLPVKPDLQATEAAQTAARLPRLLPGTRLHAGFLLALLAAVALWFLLYRTTLGYRLRTVGISPGAAAYAGIAWGATITLAMTLSGVLSGLAGAAEALGLHGRYYNVQSGYGFTSIAVGLVGRNHPGGVVLAGLLFGALNAGSTHMQNTAGASKDLVSVLQGLVILSVSAFAAFDEFRKRRRQAARAGAMTTDRASEDIDGPDLEPRPGTPAL